MNNNVYIVAACASGVHCVIQMTERQVDVVCV